MVREPLGGSSEGSRPRLRTGKFQEPAACQSKCYQRAADWAGRLKRRGRHRRPSARLALAALPRRCGLRPALRPAPATRHPAAPPQLPAFLVPGLPPVQPLGYIHEWTLRSGAQRAGSAPQPAAQGIRKGHWQRAFAGGGNEVMRKAPGGRQTVWHGGMGPKARGGEGGLQGRGEQRKPPRQSAHAAGWPHAWRAHAVQARKRARWLRALHACQGARQEGSHPRFAVLGACGAHSA